MSTTQKLVIGFWIVTYNHKVNKYWASADFGIVSTKEVCRSGQKICFTHY